MEPFEIEQAVKSLQKFDWSSEPLDLDPIASLDPNSLIDAKMDFCARRQLDNIDEIKFCEAIGVIKDGILTKGGLIFLGKTTVIHKELGLLEYRFTWKTKSGIIIINDVWEGNIWKTIKRTKEHFDSCNSDGEIDYKGKKYKIPFFDPIAFHEAYLNALVHRDYSSEGMVSADYMDLKITITNPGPFFGGVTADNIAIHEPRHRNKNLAKILMNFHLIDRAGMGVLRMGIGSLKYGRSFPEFQEIMGSVQVKMMGQLIRSGIFVLTNNHPHKYGIPELIILNSLYNKGHIEVNHMEQKLKLFTKEPWEVINNFSDDSERIELCGTNKGVYIRVTKSSSNLLGVTQRLRTHASSKKHVDLYSYLKKHGKATNQDISELFGHSHSSQTSKFLKNAEYVYRKGSGPSARWQLQENGK